MENKNTLTSLIHKKIKSYEDSAHKLEWALKRYQHDCHDGLANDDGFRRLILNNERWSIDILCVDGANDFLSGGGDKRVSAPCLYSTFYGLPGTGDPLAQKLKRIYEREYRLSKPEEVHHVTMRAYEVASKMVLRTLTEKEYEGYLMEDWK